MKEKIKRLRYILVSYPKTGRWDFLGDSGTGGCLPWQAPAIGLGQLAQGLAIIHKEKRKWSRADLSIPKCDDIYRVLIIGGSNAVG